MRLGQKKTQRRGAHPLAATGSLARASEMYVLQRGIAVTTEAGRGGLCEGESVRKRGRAPVQPKQARGRECPSWPFVVFAIILRAYPIVQMALRHLLFIVLPR